MISDEHALEAVRAADPAGTAFAVREQQEWAGITRGEIGAIIHAHDNDI